MKDNKFRMYKTSCLIIIVISLFITCGEDEPTIIDNVIPVVQTQSLYTVLKDENISYAEGLAHDESSITPFALPIQLDVYYLDNSSENRPVYMFIHGGGFMGGIKHLSLIHI